MGADAKEREKFEARLHAPIEGSKQARDLARQERREVAMRMGAISG